MPIRVVLLGEDSAALAARVTALPTAFDFQMSGAYTDRAAALDALERLLPDVVLASAQLRDGSTFDLLASLTPALRPTSIVFLSARDGDAVRAFELQATDFVPMPLQEARFLDAMVRARQVVLEATLMRTADELQRLLGDVAALDALRGTPAGGVSTVRRGGMVGTLAPQVLGAGHVRSALAGAARDAHRDVNSGASDGDGHRDHAWRGARSVTGTVSAARSARDGEERVLDLTASPNSNGGGAADGRPLRVMVREGRRTRFVPLTEVDWFEADGNYIVVHAAAQTYRTRGTISAIEAVLDPRQFVRIHRRMVVNMDRVREMSPLPGGDGLLMLGNGSTLRLSRTYRSRVR